MQRGGAPTTRRSLRGREGRNEQKMEGGVGWRVLSSVAATARSSTYVREVARVAGNGQRYGWDPGVGLMIGSEASTRAAALGGAKGRWAADRIK